MSLIMKLLGLGKAKASVIVIGLQNSGKTSIVQCLHTDRDKDEDGVAPTVGFAVDRFAFSRAKLTVWDMSGASNYHTLWECYFKDVQGVIFVVDSADPASVEEASRVLSTTMSHEDLQGLPLLVMANKMDLAAAMSKADVGQRLQLDGLQGRTWQIAECSAKTGEGVEEAVKWILQQVKKIPKKRV
mmetsp:Transcript_15311/g.42822  ORF Transcript_15311/g.42822 Transcript_15311/m.42822 type:complete len:186 (+) Transcript_15311:273-830(+)